MNRSGLTPRAVNWISTLIVGVGTFLVVLGSSHLAATVDHFGIVLAYIALVVAIELALVVGVRRLGRMRPGTTSPEKMTAP